ncbi:unnamed protein product [Coregonus sp. 'balchen']|nr:unnamed protein product [Coregonus sp. 'balchen']
MLVLTFTCRVLLIILFSESIQTESSPPFLITENMWPRGCALDCHRGRHRTVCGSNGRLYKSLCTFQRAQCINTQLRTAPRAHCADSTQSKCQLARSQALESSVRSHTVPECSADGSFLQVQCHNQTGYCWCSTPDGKPVSGTSVLHLRPNCTGEGGPSRPTADPSRPQSAAGITAPPLWVTILLNSDSKGNRSVKHPTAPSSATSPRGTAGVSGKTRDGLYQAPLPGTGCQTAVWRSPTAASLTGTTETDPYQGALGPGRKSSCRVWVSDAPLSGTMSPPPSTSVPSLGVEEWDMSGVDGGLRWHFRQLDTDDSGVLTEREARPLRLYLRRRLKPRRCAKKFAQYCDRDGDRGLTLSELSACLGL